MHSYNQDRTYLTSPKMSSCPFIGNPFLCSQALATTDVFFISVLSVLLFPEFHVNKILQYVAFWIWLISMSIMHLKFTNVVVYISSFFTLLRSAPLCGCTTIWLSI